MNSILQCVFATTPLTKYIQDNFKSEKKLRNTPIASAYFDLLYDARRSKGGSITPSDLKNKLSNNQRRFTPAIEVNSKEQQLILLPAQETVIQ